MKVVVVESPAKAKTINKYLGSDYKVVASYGHVRDLPAKDGSVLPDADFAMSWEVDGKSEKHMKTIFEAVRNADRLFLATDPDREGEAISWHVREVLNSRRGLKHLDVKRLDRFDLDTEAKARAAADAILRASDFTVAEIDSRQVRRNPFPPFTTSTLQQEASRKLGLAASRTMQVAQRLYEGIELDGETVGLITYMRTDGVAVAGEAITAARRLIGDEFGGRYVPSEPRVYRSPAKNAQEAHEAIRPTDLARKPNDVARHLDRDQLRLYELIWKRTVASQMASALLEQVAVDIADAAGRLRLRANGSVILFDGFLTLYQEDRDDTSADEEGEGGRLPAMRKAERLARGEVMPSQHFTQPPPRYTEASLV